jgi:hypothetical protein
MGYVFLIAASLAVPPHSRVSESARNEQRLAPTGIRQNRFSLVLRRAIFGLIT